MPGMFCNAMLQYVMPLYAVFHSPSTMPLEGSPKKFSNSSKSGSSVSPDPPLSASSLTMSPKYHRKWAPSEIST